MDGHGLGRLMEISHHRDGCNQRHGHQQQTEKNVHIIEGIFQIGAVGIRPQAAVHDQRKDACHEVSDEGQGRQIPVHFQILGDQRLGEAENPFIFHLVHLPAFR